MAKSDTSFFASLNEFERVVLEEHKKNRRTREFVPGAYHYHGMDQYGNIVDFGSAISACQVCSKTMGFKKEDFERLGKWYAGRSIDSAVMSVAIREFLRLEGKNEDPGLGQICEVNV